MYISTETKTSLMLTSQELTLIAKVQKIFDDINESLSENSKIGYLPYEDLFEVILETNYYESDGLKIYITN